MSLGYASRLSHREDLGGRLGDPELADEPRAALRKATQLAELVGAASKVVAFTGAGISTSTGIPDFRGPQGVWTLQRAGLPPPRPQTSFLYAKPSLTHQALLGLMQSGKLAYICSQNVDSLHLRSGVPRGQLAELHGNCFAERCKACKAEYVRDFEMDTVGFKPTGRRCVQPGCRGVLLDHILDWEDALPPAELKATQQHASSADLALCLGTSLQIIPAANLPLRTVKAGGKLAIVNLQATPKDKRADVVVHARVDEVMSFIMHRLGIPITPYRRTDRVLLSHTYAPVQQRQAACDGGEPEPEAGGRPEAAAGEAGGAGGAGGAGAGGWGFAFTVSSVHGAGCPMPMVQSASVSFPGPAAAALRPRELSGAPPWRLTRNCPATLEEVAVRVELRLVDAADEGQRLHVARDYVVRRPSPEAAAAAAARRATRRQGGAMAQQQQQADGSRVIEFVTQVLDYTERQQQLVRQLEDRAAAAPPEQPQPAAAAPAAGASGGESGGGGGGGQEGSGEEDEDDSEEDDSEHDSNRGGSGGGGADRGDPDFTLSDEEPTGQGGQNTYGRPRKRSRRFDL